jgi:hypothetical protein
MSIEARKLADAVLAVTDALIAREYLEHAREQDEEHALGVAAALRAAHGDDVVSSAGVLAMFTEARERAWLDSEVD